MRLVFRAYLSSTGNDANPCTLPAPCRLLPAALAAVQNGGEIWMMDSANFNTGPVNITKGVKIFAIPGALGSVVGNGGDALIINTAGDVTLRNLQILNFSGGVNGVTIQNAGAVHIEKTSIDGFNTDASSCIRFAVTTPVRLYVDDSFLRHCRNGIYATGTVVSGDQALISLDNTRIERGFGPTVAYGIWMQGCVAMSMRNSVVAWDQVGIGVVGIQTDSLLPGCSGILEVVNSQIFGDDAAVAIRQYDSERDRKYFDHRQSDPGREHCDFDFEHRGGRKHAFYALGQPCCLRRRRSQALEFGSRRKYADLCGAASLPGHGHGQQQSISALQMAPR